MPVFFMEKFLAYELQVYDFSIGALMNKREFEKIAETPKFNQMFVFKGLHDMVFVHYLAQRIEKGPQDGSNPSPVAVVEKSVALPSNDKTKALELKLKAANVKDPEGDA